MKKTWFKRKRYGWGWVPSAWQGWLVLLAYLAGILFLLKLNGNDAILPFILLTIALIAICFATGEKPRWQWGADHREQA